MFSELCAELRDLAAASFEAADASVPETELRANYLALRSRAEALNRQNGWMTLQEMDTVLPPLDALLLIESLDIAFGAEANPALDAERGTEARLREALGAIGAWSTGLQLAVQTLSDDEAN